MDTGIKMELSFDGNRIVLQNVRLKTRITFYADGKLMSDITINDYEFAQQEFQEYYPEWVNTETYFTFCSAVEFVDTHY